jgi:hypothetical protein
MVAACQGLPEVRESTQRTEIAPDFEGRICEGTQAWIDDHVEAIERRLQLASDPDPILIYWLESGVEEVCGEGRSGCFFPGVRAVFTTGRSLGHEIVHAVVDSQGEAYFLEEGLAEVLSGVDLAYAMGEQTPDLWDRLRQSPREYRQQGFDYAEAGHFVRWLERNAGTHAIAVIGRVIDGDPSPEYLRDTLEEATDATLVELQERWRESPQLYAGEGARTLPTLKLSTLAEGMDIALDCDAITTQGPRDGEGEGMYRVFRLEVGAASRVQIHIDGPGGVYAEIIDPVRVRDDQRLDWRRPPIDGHLVRVESGWIGMAELAAQSYLLIVGSDSTAFSPSMRLWVTVTERL